MAEMLASITEAKDSGLFVLADEWDDELANGARPYIELYYKQEAKDFKARVGADPDYWSVVNPKLNEAVDKAVFKFAESTNRTTSMELSAAIERLRDELRQGLVHGEPVRELTNRVQEVFDRAEQSRAMTIAATEASRALHDAQVISGEASSVVVGWRFLASDDACPICLEIAESNPVIPMGGSFAQIGSGDYSDIKAPPVHPNCLLGETSIFASNVRRTIVAQYSGPVVRLVTEGGNLTVTSNHLLLTPFGFARAASLREGDQVIYYGGFKGPISGNPNDYESPSPIEDVVASLSESGSMCSVSVPVATEYLHGDGTFINSDIGIESSDGFLVSDRNAAIRKHVGQPYFNWANTELMGFSKSSSLASVLLALRSATDGGMGIRRDAVTFNRSHTRHSDDECFGESTNMDASIKESSTNGRTTYSNAQGNALFGFSRSVAANDGININRQKTGESIGLLQRPNGNSHFAQTSFNRVTTYSNRISNALKRFSSQVSLLPITRIEFLHWSGPVYDLETSESMYIAGGIVVSNCQCAMTEILDNDEDAALVTGGKDRSKSGGAAVEVPVEVGA